MQERIWKEAKEDKLEENQSNSQSTKELEGNGWFNESGDKHWGRKYNEQQK
jgi:hypothetical protein